MWIVLSAILVLFALLAGVVYAVRRHERAALEVLARSTCPACGHAVTLAGAASALRAVRARREALLSDAAARGIRLRLSSNWWFPCPGCGAELDYVPMGELRVLQR